MVQALAEKKSFVPYRDSKLTRILEDSVGGNCKTSLLVCCSPASDSSDETVSTLEFASRAMRIETCAVVNEGNIMIDPAKLAADLAGDGRSDAVKEKQMLELKQKLGGQVKAAEAAGKAAREAAEKAANHLKKKGDQKEKLIREAGPSRTVRGHTQRL